MWCTAAGTVKWRYQWAPELSPIVFFLMDIEAFHFVLGTEFFVQHSQIQSLTLQAPYLL